MIGDGFKSDPYGPYIEKGPEATLDYGFLFDSWLKGDTITGSAWTLPVGLVEVSTSHDASSTAIVISGGVAGTAYAIKNTIVTAGGLTDSRAFRILCV